MCVYIGIEDLVANALIELVEKANRKEVLFKSLDEYGAMVVKCLKNQNEQAVLIISRERTSLFLHDYSDLFELFTAENGIDEGIRLKDGIEVERLWLKFRSYISVDLLLAFMDEQAVSKLGVQGA